MHSLEVLRKVSKWTDDIKKDTRFFGVGSVQNQIQLENGARYGHPCEDKSFSYEFKEGEIFAYGVLDGYNGSWTVDLLEQCLLTNMYFDHLQTIQKKTDNEIYSVLSVEFQKAEQCLQENLQELLLKRASRTVLSGEFRKGTAEYYDNVREINLIDKQISSGAFAVVSLVIDQRLFVANVGTCHCFLCITDSKNPNETSVLTLDSQHTLSNSAEYDRLKSLNASLNAYLEINYTRCLGNFKLKLYYHEFPQFKDCTGPPVTYQAQHPPFSLVIDDSYLFLAMYSDGLAKVMDTLGDKSENIPRKIADMLINKIKSEQTLNSAAQSVLDEIKRAYDDKVSSTYNEREDFTLTIRIFDLNLKNRLIQMENATIYNNNEVKFIETLDDDVDETLNSLKDTINSNESNTEYTNRSNEVTTSTNQSRREDIPINNLLDEEGKVLTYVDFKEIDDLLELEENKTIFDDFSRQLMALADELPSVNNEFSETTKI